MSGLIDKNGTTNTRQSTGLEMVLSYINTKLKSMCVQLLISSKEEGFNASFCVKQFSIFIKMKSDFRNVFFLYYSIALG